jgi:hypothetical protein
MFSFLSTFFNPAFLTFGADIKKIIFNQLTVVKEFKTTEGYKKTMEFYNYVDQTFQHLFPKIIVKHDKENVIVTEHCGTLLNLHRLPTDWEAQFNEFRTFFKEKQILILDIRFMPHTPYVINNLCLKEGRIYLIDLGFYKGKNNAYIDRYFDKLISQVKLYQRYANHWYLLIPLHFALYFKWLITDLIEKIRG